jgi:hypothetical protein
MEIQDMMRKKDVSVLKCRQNKFKVIMKTSRIEINDLTHNKEKVFKKIIWENTMVRIPLKSLLTLKQCN